MWGWVLPRGTLLKHQTGCSAPAQPELCQFLASNTPRVYFIFHKVLRGQRRAPVPAAGPVITGGEEAQDESCQGCSTAAGRAELRHRPLALAPGSCWEGRFASHLQGCSILCHPQLSPELAGRKVPGCCWGLGACPSPATASVPS